MRPDSPEVARLKATIRSKTKEIATLNAALLKSQDECAKLRRDFDAAIVAADPSKRTVNERTFFGRL
jgi:septal ring factor EnvC (AmiA/AmiB activator)